MTEQHKAAVTVAGLGAMGGTLATVLLQRGYTVKVWNRTASKADDLVKAGAVFIPDLAKAIASSPVTILCVSDHAASVEALNADTLAAAKGRTLIQLSTITSAESRELATMAERAGVHFLDGQILAYPQDILEARANIVCSGPSDLFDAHRTMLKDMAGNVIHVGQSHGAAPSFAKAHDSYSLGFYLAFLQGAAMCAQSGVDLRAWCDYNLRHMKNGNVERELTILADQVCSRSYDEGLGATMDVWKGAADKIAEESQSAGANLAHLTPLLKLMDAAIADGGGEKEIGILFEEMIRPGS